MPADKRDGPVPRAVASAIAHQFAKDVVIVFTLDHARELCHHTAYGRTERDKEIAAKLAEVLGAVLSEAAVTQE